MAQCLVRDKRKITRTGIPFIIPAAADLCTTAGCVLMMIYLSYNADYLEPSASDRELSDDVIWLVELVARAMPESGGGVETACTADVSAVAHPGAIPDQDRLLRLQGPVGPLRMTWRSVGADGIWGLRPRSVSQMVFSYRRRLPLP